MYFPVAVTGALVYGKTVQANLLLSISPGPLLYMVQILITCHLVCSFVICLNPVAQQLEELLKLKKTFSWHRIVSRSLMVAFVLFVAETIPKFGTLLSLIGGSTITMMAFVCPPLFYLKLCSMKGHWPQIVVPLHQKVLLLEILIVGSVVGLMSTFSSVQSMASPDSFTVPCYINMTAACG
ncbi:amino acid transporter AVT3B [Aplysia californica]|uniref:Amino acid transporter AVT3B n=1 Tax=Aplysia californica TaxID=6500 RepID=A0ABM0JEJ0_APLCA|nr:amino acid transporter AVT3B [Aplysia californica]